MAMRQAASLVDFDAKPLIVVTAGRGHNAEWMAAQDRLATLSTNSEHRVVADATHESLLLVRTDAAAATKAIRDVVTSVRTASPPELARRFSPVRYAVQAEVRQNPDHVRAGRSPIDAAYSQAPRSSAWQMTNVLVEAPVATCVES